MCGRYAIGHVWKEIQERFKAGFKGEWKQRYNASPGQDLPVILQEDPEEIVLSRWGLIPHWSKDRNSGYKMINARSETLSERPSYKTSFQNKRCIIIASGFYEWKDKVPYYFYHCGDAPLALAGLYDRWEGTSGELIVSFTIITTPPNPLLKRYHDRMPLILDDERPWLSPGTTQHNLMALLTPYKGDLSHHRVSRDVSNPRNDYPSLIQEEKTPWESLNENP